MMPPGGAGLQGPGVNQLPTPRAHIKVANIPSFVTADDFSRLMLQLEGCVDAKLLGRLPGGDQVGYGEFSDKLSASKAKNLYHGWTGWGGRGLAIELSDLGLAQPAQQQAAPGQKRLREGEDLLQSGTNFKQARPDMPAMGMGGGQQGTGQPDVGGLLQNLSSVTNLLQQQGIAQQLLAAAQQQTGVLGQQQQGQGMLGQQGGGQMGGGGGLMGGGQGGGGVYEPYNPASMAPSNNMQQQGQSMGGMMGGGGMMPQQQQPAQQQYAPVQQPQPMQQYGGGMMQQEQGGGYGMGGPMQPQQQVMMQGGPQQQYGMGPQQPQAQPQMMQPMGQVGGMMPQQPQMMQGPPQQQMMQPQQQGPMGPGGRRGDVVPPTAMRQYPPDACNTLYIEGLPPDVTRRELSHIFRKNEGFRSLRLVIKDSKKHVGEKLVMAFIEYTNTYFATEAMDALQGYPFDLDDPETMTFFIKYARPMAGGRPGGGPPPMIGGRGRGGPPPPLGGGRPGGPGPDFHGGRGGPMDGRGGRGGRGGGRFGPGGPPPRESPRGRDY